jgi:outer membrane beta-barrel protein
MRKNLICKSVLVSLLLLPCLAGAAEERRSPLEGQPAVRHRLELRKGRFEGGISTGVSLNRFLRHAILVGAKLEYHLTDWLGVGADFGYGIGLDTGLSGEIKGKYDANEWSIVSKRFSDIKLAGDVRATLTPFTGKLALFSKLFFNYDFYAFGGVALAMTENGGSAGDFGDDDVDAANEGFRVGAAFGFGMHLFFNKWFSMGLELKDLMFADNESGFDLTRGLEQDEVEESTVKVNGDDSSFTSHFFVGMNFTFYLPTVPEISD